MRPPIPPLMRMCPNLKLRRLKNRHKNRRLKRTRMIPNQSQWPLRPLPNPSPRSHCPRRNERRCAKCCANWLLRYPPKSPSLMSKRRSLCVKIRCVQYFCSTLRRQSTIGKLIHRKNATIRAGIYILLDVWCFCRVKAVTYRRVLAEIGHDYESLGKVWQDSKREGLEAIVNKIVELKDEERTELTELLDCHYDPDKQAFKPIVKRNKHNSNRGKQAKFYLWRAFHLSI